MKRKLSDTLASRRNIESIIRPVCLSCVVAVLLSFVSAVQPPRAQVQSNKCGEIAKQVNDLQRKVENDQRAIRNLRFETREQDFKEWEGLSKDSKSEMKRVFLDSLLTLTFTKALQKIDSFKPLSRSGADELVRKMQSLGIDEPFLFDAVRGLAISPRDLTAKKKQWTRFIESLSQIKDTAILASKNHSSEDTNMMLESIATVLGFAIEDPKLALMVNIANSGESLIYNTVGGVVIAKNVERLTQLTEDELRSLTNLSELLKKHVEELNEAKQQLSACNNRENTQEANGYFECKDRCWKEFISCYNRALPGPVKACADNCQSCYDDCCKKYKDCPFH